MKNMNSMFDFCSNLKYLNLRNFDYSGVTTADLALNGCKYALKYLNIYSYKDNDVFNSFFFEITNKNIIYCINAEKATDLFSYLTSNNYIINCSYIPPNEKEEDNIQINTEELMLDNNNRIPK